MQYQTPQEALHALVRAYYEERNIPFVLTCVTDDIEWIGTDDNDSASGKQALQILLEKDKENNPNSFRVEIEEPRIQKMDSDCVLFTIVGIQKDVPGIADGLLVRGSVCCIKTEQGWLVNHVHTSNTSKDREKQSLEKEIEFKAKQDMDRFRLAADEIHAAIFEWNLKEDTFYHSAAYDQYAISLVNPKEILTNTGPLDAVHPDDIHVLKQFFVDSTKMKKRIECTLRLKLVTEGYRWCHMIGLFYYGDNDKPIHVIGIIIDVDSEHATSVKMANLLNTVPAGIGIFEFDENGISENYMNDAFYHLIGAKREDRQQYSGKNILASVHPKDQDLITSQLGQLLKGKESTELDYRIMGGNGNWVWLHLVATVVERQPGKVKLHVAYYECTERKSEQLLLLQNQKAVTLAGKQGRIAIWIYNIDQETLQQSILSEEDEQLGYSASISNVPQCFVDAGDVYPEDIEKYLLVYQKLKDGEENVNETYRLKDQRTGEFNWIRMYYQRADNNDDGDRIAVGFSIIVNDQQQAIERYQAEEKLREQMYASAIVYMEYNLTKSVYVGKNNLKNTYRHGRWECPSIEEYRENMSQNVEPEYLDNVVEKMYAGNLLDAFERGETKVSCDYRSKARIDQPSFWCRITAVMVKRPDTLDVMAFVYVENIEEEKDRHLAIESSMTDGIESVALIRVSDRQTRLILEMGIRLRKEKAKLVTYNDEFVSRSSHATILEEREFSYQAALLSTIEKELEKKEIYQYAITTQMKDGERKRKLFRFRYLDDRKADIVMSVSDITSIYREEQRQKKQLELALSEAKIASQAKTNFLSRVSHDMRTPLNGILGLTTLLKDSVTDQSVLNDLGELEMSGKYLLNLINDTLDMSRIENGRLELHPIVFEGREMLNNAIRMGKISIQNRDIHLHVQVPDTPFTLLYVDVNRVQQIFMNIFGNAVKFTPDGGTIDFKMVNLSVEDNVITNKLTLSDNGVGMSPDFLPHIFEAFSQADTSKTTRSQGTGLGMAITKQLVELMGGTITAESELGRGTTITWILKLHMATNEQIEEWKRTQKVTKTVGNIAGKRVLLVEDHPLNAKIATRLLQTQEVLVEHAENGQIGVEMFKHSPVNYYDAILMDIRMPVMDGIEATQVIRGFTRSDAKAVPIIAMTANAFAEDVEQTKAAGMDGHLSKPIEPALLFSTLSEKMRIPQIIRKQRILIVDDVEVNRVVVRLSLEKDYEILEAENGNQALEILQKGGIDAVITDIQMPGMDGEELIRKIRSDKKNRNLVIIANTQYGDPTQEETLLSLGANDFVYKPTTPTIIEIRVRNALRQR